MATNIYDAYNQSVVLVRNGADVAAAIAQSTKSGVAYAHDAGRMLAHWHSMRVQPFGVDAGQYPARSVQS